jgi:hypothetical protein
VHACHITATDGQLGMKDATTAYTNLVGTTMGVAAKTDLNCKLLDASKKRVVINDPAHSYLYIKIATPQATLTTNTCGPAMPEKPNSTLTLTTDQIMKVRDWIHVGREALIVRAGSVRGAWSTSAMSSPSSSRPTA